MPTINPNRAGNPSPSYKQLLAQLQGVAAPAAGTSPQPPAGDVYLSSRVTAGGGPSASLQSGASLVRQGLRGLFDRIVGWLKAHNPFHPSPPAAPRTHTVRQGETLSSIARDELGDANRWSEIYELNRDKIANPNLIYPGQVLTLPGGASPAQPPSYGEPWQPGPGELQGADTSHWQTDAEFNSSIQGAKWTAIKASQGTGYTDPTFQARWAQLGQKIQDGSMKLRMAYCYLDSGDGAAQAKHFLDVVGVHGRLPAGTRLALDWEGAALNSPQTLKDAANYVHQVTGLWPVIYVQGSKLSVAQSAVPDAPFWEAAWSADINRNVAFFQYSNGPVYDHDVFNGNQAALERFAGWA
ncbi:MAG TPA: GH25 family lysozyme [Stenomitos sp.]